MSEQTGIQYPTLEIGGKAYEVKFTAATLYRLGKAGISFAPSFNGKAKEWRVEFANLVDTLKVVIGFEGPADELADLIYEQKDEVTRTLLDGWGKVVLPTLQRRAEAAKARLQANLAEAPAANSQPV